MFTTLKNTLKENNNKGFTLLENILVVAIIAILLGIGAVGVAQYMDNADELERMGAAQTLYMSLQNYLVEEQKAGRLDTFNAMVNAGDTYTLFDYTSSVSENAAEKAILKENGQTFDATFANKHDGTKIVAVFYDGENKNQAEYQNIYNLFVTLGVDTGILDNQFVFEYNQTTGIVQSVFFTKEPGVKFTVDSYSTGAPTTVDNVLARGEAAIDTKKQGYYGLYETSALSEKVQSIINSEVVLVNDDRIYLTFRAEKPKNGNNFNKHFQVYLKGSTDEKIKGLKYNIKEVTPIGNFTEISTALDSLDMHTSGGKTKDNNGVTHISARYVDMNDETAIYFVVLSCGEEDTFLDLAKKGELGTSPEKAEVYIKFEDGINLKSNAINPFFESVTSENDKDIYNLSCSRHLANLNKGKEINSTLDWKLLHYRVVDDINLMQYEREENHLPEVLSVVTGIDENEILANSKLGSKGLSKTQADTLPTDSTRRHFKGSVAPVLFGETGKGLQYFAGVFEGAKKNDGTKYSITGVTLIAETTKENGFFKRNQGTIQNLAFKKATVYSGFCAGIICGRNNGDIHGVDLEEFVVAHEWDSYKNLGHEKTMAETDETTVNDGGHTIDENGKIKTKNPYGYNGSMVGGICGISYQSVKNCTATRGIVYGEESYGGGIVGWAYSSDIANNDIYSIENCVVTDCFVSAAAKSGGIAGDCAFKISNCKVLKEDDSKLTPVGLQFRPAGKDALRRERLTKDVYPSVVASRNSCRVGGIVGFSNNSIENCVNYLDVCQKIDEGTTNSPSTDEIQNVGGIVGILGYSKKRNNSYSITNCKNYGNVTCYEERRKPTDPETKFVGGIVGLSYFPIDSCENYGNVVGVFSEGVGGIAGGTVNDIKNCRVLTNPKSSKQSVDATLKISGRKYVGGIVGVANSGTLENCYVGCEKATSGEVNKASGNIIIAATEYDPAKGSYNFEGVGGICGSCNKDGNFGNVTEYKLLSCSCYADINTVNNIDILQYCGGIVGRSFSKVNVEQSSHVGNITANKDMETTGGICGYVNNVATISLSTNSGEIKASGTMSQTGGICGYTKGATISSSTNAGEIKADGNMSNVGGIVGVNESAGLTINTVTNNAGISTKGSMIGTGGIVGNSAKAATITTTENKGAITASLTMSQTGGICGYVKGATIGSSTNDGEIKAGGDMSDVGGIVGVNESAGLTINTVTNNAGISSEGGMIGTGGIVGNSAKAATITTTENKGAITASLTMSQTGGICGYIKGATIKLSTNSGVIVASGNMSEVGGIVGYNETSKLTTQAVTNDANITTTGEMFGVGGICGYSDYEALIDGLLDESSQMMPTKNNGTISSTGKMSQTGGIVGSAAKKLTLKNVSNTNNGAITSSAPYNKDNPAMNQVGGIVGYLSGASNTFTSVTNAGTISTTGTGTMSQTGGIVGATTQDLTLKTSANTNAGDIIANAEMTQVGGIAGYLSGTSNAFTSVTNAGAISTTGTGKMSQTGGVVGVATTALTLKTVENANDGAITASAAMSQVGGIAGYLSGTSNTFTSVTNAGTISTTGKGTMSLTGGIVGEVVNFLDLTFNTTKKTNTNSNVGTISASAAMTQVGGVIGQFDVAYTASYLKNSGKITGNGTLQDVGGIIGKQNGGGSYTGFINSGTIESKNKMTAVGGILGNANANVNSSITISSATNTGNILPGANGSTDIGGIVGYISKCNFEINDSNSDCSIGILNPDSPNANYVLLADTGGILGRTGNINNGEGSKYKGTINNCKADVKISALGTKNEGIGGIAGYTRMSMDFLNCSVTGTLVAKQMGVGGLAGACVSSSIMYTNVEGCTTNVQILVKAAESNNDKYAGLIAYTKTNLTINDCITRGDIKADPGIPLKNSSGFLGYSTTADATNGGITMTNCVSYLNIYTDNKLLRGGGLFSNIDSVPFVDIHNNYAMGDITYGYAGMSGGLGGRLNTKLSGQMYNCYYGGKIIKLSNRDDIVSGDSFMNKDSVTKAYIDTQTGYLLGQLNFAQTGVFQDCYVYENCVDIEKGPYTGYENTSDINYLTIRRIAGLKGANSFNVDNANVVYQTHRNAKDVAYKNNAILNELEYKKLCYLFDIEANYSETPETNIKYLMDHYIKDSVKNAENWQGEANAVRTVTFKCTEPEGYQCTIEYDGHTFAFDENNTFSLPVESTDDGAAPILHGEKLNFKIIDAKSSDDAYKIKNTDLVVVNWTPNGGSSVLIKPSAEGVYTVGSVLADGEISIVIDTAPVVTYEFKLEDGTAVPSADVSKYLSLESIVGMERFAGVYRYHVTEPSKVVSFTTRMNQAGYYCELNYSSNPSNTFYLAGGSVTDAQKTTVTEDVTVTYTIVKCPKIKIHYKNNLGEDLAYSNNFDVSNASRTKKFNDYSADCYSLYSAMTTPSNTDFKLKIKMKDGYKYILFDEKGEVIGKYDQESDAVITEYVTAELADFDLYLVRYPAKENWDDIDTMPVSLSINLVAEDGYTWNGETSLKVRGDINSKTTEEKKVTFTVDDTDKTVDYVEIGDTKLTPVSKGENKYEVTIPVGTKVGDAKVVFKSEPEDVTFNLTSGEGFRWEDVSGNEISSVDVDGTGTDPNVTAEDKIIYLIVNEGKVLETVELGDTPLSFSSATSSLEDGSEKYEVTIASGSEAGIITATVKAESTGPEDIKIALSSDADIEWKDTSGNSISSIDIAGTGEDPNVTDEPKTIVLIVTSSVKELDRVTLGDNTNLTFSGPEDGNKYTITIPAGSPAGTITVTLKAKEPEEPDSTPDSTPESTPILTSEGPADEESKEEPVEEETKEEPVEEETKEEPVEEETKEESVEESKEESVEEETKEGPADEETKEESKEESKEEPVEEETPEESIEEPEPEP